MSSLIINKTISFIKNHSDYSNTELNKIRYGIEGVYLTITKIIVVLLIGILFRYTDVIILMLLFFNILRFFAFGLHAKKSWQCLILSILGFNILPLIFMKTGTSSSFLIIIGIISIVSFLLFAPSDTEKRPLTNARKRFIRKVLSIIVGTIYIILAFKIKYLMIPIVCSLIIESIMINPICYRILGLKYRNYKK